jgi:multicomponent Na+:H+ antiporter subunit D
MSFLNFLASKYIYYILFLPSISSFLMFFVKNTKLSNKVMNFLSIFISLSYLLIALHIIQQIGFTNKEVILFQKDIFDYSLVFKNFKISSVFLTLVSVIYPISLIFAIGYFNDPSQYKSILKIKLFSNLAMVFAMLTIFAEDFIVMFITYECLTISTMFLIRYDNSIILNKVSMKYLKSMMSFSVIFLLPALILIANLIDIDKFSINNGTIVGSIPFSAFLINSLYFLTIAGILKIALFPFFKWLIIASKAPAPISGLLHAIVVVKTGIIILFKMTFFVFGSKTLSSNLLHIQNYNLLTIIAIFSILFASINALLNENIKTRLAYSTMSYLSQMVLIISLFQYEINNVLILFTINHSIAKLTIFFACGYLYKQTKATLISEIKKYNIRRSIIIKIAILLSIINLAGLPISFGFFVKKKLLIYLIDKQFYLTMIVFMFSAIASILYLVPIIINIKKSEHANVAQISSKNYYIEVSLALLILLQIFVTTVYSFRKISLYI